MRSSPTVGLIVPPAAGAVPPDGPALYPDVRFLAAGLGLSDITVRGYDEVIDRVSVLAVELVARGADAVSLMGTSLGFYRGPTAHDRLVDALRDATGGRPVSTMSLGVVGALRALGVRRVAVGTAYVEEVNRRLAAFLAATGFEVTALEGLSMTDVDAVGRVDTGELVELGRRVHGADGRAAGILLSCGGLLTLDAIAQLEDELGVPVVASSPAGFWDAVRLVGHGGRAGHPGRLFALSPHATPTGRRPS